MKMTIHLTEEEVTDAVIEYIAKTYNLATQDISFEIQEGYTSRDQRECRATKFKGVKAEVNYPKQDAI